MYGYDIIGDVHGHADRLERLLRNMGYVRSGSGWRPPQGRLAIFAGDLINRGPGQLATCRTVRSMIDDGHALAVLGNHEVHAIGYGTCASDVGADAAAGSGDCARHGSGGVGGRAWLRPRTAWADRQHQAFLAEVGRDSALHRELIGWLRTLPIVLELGADDCGIRVVHAWWDAHSVARLHALLPAGNLASDDAVRRGLGCGACAGDELATVIERLSRGQCLPLPAGLGFTDRRGLRHDVLWARWWDDGATNLRELAFIDDDQRDLVPALGLPPDYVPTRIEGRPVIVGHYWMAGAPKPFSAKVACVDWSASSGQPLLAYRWDGEQTLDAGHFASSETRQSAIGTQAVAEFA